MMEARYTPRLGQASLQPPVAAEQDVVYESEAPGLASDALATYDALGYVRPELRATYEALGLATGGMRTVDLVGAAVLAQLSSVDLLQAVGHAPSVDHYLASVTARLADLARLGVAPPAPPAQQGRTQRVSVEVVMDT